MRRGVIVIIGLILMAPTALAATLVSTYSVEIKSGQARTLPPIMITSTSDQDIRAVHGINLVIPADTDAVWELKAPNMIGTAFDNKRVMLNVQVVYREGGKVLYIPVLEDFESGDYLQLQGLMVRAGEEAGLLRLGMDLDGDAVADVNDVNPHALLTNMDALEFAYDTRCHNAHPSNIACLWARINLLYAQETMGEVRIEGLELTAQDLRQMEGRRRWPEMRYERNCENAPQSAGYCERLGGDLEKIRYFLD